MSILHLLVVTEIPFYRAFPDLDIIIEYLDGSFFLIDTEEMTERTLNINTFLEYIGMSFSELNDSKISSNSTLYKVVENHSTKLIKTIYTMDH